MPDISLVIFDCDGVLVDSEPLAVRLLRDMLGRRGLVFSLAESYAKFLGRSLASILSDLETDHGLRLGPTDLEDMRRELAELFRAELQPVPHVAGAVAALKRRFAVCVASSSLPERLELSLDVTGLSPLFEGHVFSAAEVDHGKPAPDLFLHAARRIGAAPGACVVIEDSTAGVRAAQAAGMRVFGFFGGAHAAEAGLHDLLAAEHPDHLFADMRQLPGLLTGTGAAPAVARAPARRHLVAVDVGTASVRAGVVATNGEMKGRAERPITLWRQGAVIGEYSSEAIWQASCAAVREALANAGVAADGIAGIGFDATCSLVCLDGEGRPVSISVEPGAPRDTIAWFDHRAIEEAIEVSRSGHAVLAHSGGALSPEMEIPKLMWLKRHLPDSWSRIGNALDLADYLTWRASGSALRSQSTLTSKWTFLAHQAKGWHDDFFALAGLADLRARAGLPAAASEIGARVGTLNAAAAADLGLTQDCVVATGMVDAHAGALGVLGHFLADPAALNRELALIAGTSSCVVALSPDLRAIPGIWGPYFGAAAPGLWLNEGGQSATGALLDHIIREHAAGGMPTAARHGEIVARIATLRADPARRFGEGLHVIADHHGNRSPFHDPLARGAIVGLGLEPGFDGLCALYWRAAVGLAMGLRQILDLMGQHGYGGQTLHVAGGHAANALLMELYADATGRTIVTYPATAALLTGLAVGVAVAAGLMPDVASSGAAMQVEGRTLRPRPAERAAYEADYGEFLRLQRLLRR